MRKRYVASAAGTIGVSAVVGYLLLSKENREKLKNKINDITNKIKNDNDENPSILEEAGIPDQVNKADKAQFENAKMVSEGSQYGVQYYNEVKYDEDDDRIE